MTSASLRKYLSEFELETEAEAIAPFSTIELALLPAKRKSAGRSRIGGDPLVGPSFKWPDHRWPLVEVGRWPQSARREVAQARKQGVVHDEGDHLVMPLSFIAQVDLAEVASVGGVVIASKLPARGLLLFFASLATNTPDPLFAKRVASAVRYVDDTSKLVPMPQPPTVDPCPTGILALAPQPRLYVSMPWNELQALRKRVPSKVFKRFEREACQQTDALFARPSFEAAGLMPPKGEVALLRMVDRPEVGFFVGDASWLTFSIPKSDLLKRRFESARASVFIG